MEDPKKFEMLICVLSFLYLYLGALWRTFMIHSTAGEGGGYLFDSSLSLTPAPQALRH